MKQLYKSDLFRYDGKVPKYEKQLLRLLRKVQTSHGFFNSFWKFFYFRHCRKRNIEISPAANIDEGLYLGHTYGITINPDVKIGKNCNIHKNVTIGQENRGSRKGAPMIGNDVYFGIGCIVVGKIIVGDDVLIAPGAFVNFDVPSHSIVIGNPGKIISRKDATSGYIQNRV